MSSSLGSLLQQRELFEPPEIAVIKQFVFDRFQVIPGVIMQNTDIIIVVSGSALAGALRPHLSELKQACKTDKRLVLRVQHGA